MFQVQCGMNGESIIQRAIYFYFCCLLDSHSALIYLIEYCAQSYHLGDS
jgi:hypothetical protein